MALLLTACPGRHLGEPAIRLVPGDAIVPVGTSMAISADVANLVDPHLRWSASCGEVEADGLRATFVAPAHAQVCVIDVAVEDAPELSARSEIVVRIPMDPVEPPPLAAGMVHTLGLHGGQAVAWGDNGSGQLGRADLGFSPLPIVVSGLHEVRFVAPGAFHSLALLADGTVWAWGRNDQGQLGDGTTEDRGQPARVPGISNAVAVAATFLSSFALLADGSVWAWGSNQHGELGNGGSEALALPVKVLEVESIRRVVAGGRHVIAVGA